MLPWLVNYVWVNLTCAFACVGSPQVWRSRRTATIPGLVHSTHSWGVQILPLDRVVVWLISGRLPYHAAFSA
jgi:hypothetical protein